MFENKNQLPTTPAEATKEAAILKAEIEQDNKNLEAKIQAHENINTENQIKKEALLQQLIDEGAPQETIEFMKRSIDSENKEKRESNENKEDETKLELGTRTLEEKVDGAREVYTKEYLKCKKEMSKQILVEKTRNATFNILAGVKNTFSKEKMEKKVFKEEDYFTEEYKEAKKQYDQARIDMGNELFEKRKLELVNEGLSGEDLIKALAVYKSTEILNKTIIEEEKKLIKAKSEGLPINQATWKKALHWYSGLPRYQKVLLSTTLFAGAAAIGAGTVTGIAGIAGYRFARGMIFGTVSAQASLGLDKYNKKGNEKFKENQDSKLNTFKNLFGEGKISQEEYEEKTRILKKEEDTRKRNQSLAKLCVGVALGAGMGAIAAHEFGDLSHTSTNTPEHIGDNNPIVTTPNQQIPVLTEHNIVTTEVIKGHGAIATIRELQDKLKVEYPDPSKAPVSVQHILNTNADKLAMEYGMFKPDQIDESAMTKIGGRFDVDRDGNVMYHQTDGDAGTLLERGAEAKGTGVYEGKMFDSDHVEKNVGNIQKENISSEYDRTNLKTDIESPKTDLGEPKLKIGDELKLQEEYLRTQTKTNLEESGFKTTLSQGRDEDIKPMEGKFDNSNGTNTETISPVTGNYNTGANAGETMYHTDANTGSNSEAGNGFTKEVKMTNVAEVESRIDNSYGSKEIINNKGALGVVKLEADPRHLDNASDVRRAFGRSNVLIDKPDNDIINGVDYKEWNRATDNLFKEKDIKFTSYGDYEKEKELQELFGRGEHGVQYDPKLDKRVAGTMMYYFRESEEWPIINKIPAKYFFDFKEANIPAEDIKILVNAGVLKENISMFGVHSYSFSHQEELVRMAKIYNKFDPLNSDPLGDESIERYIGRITKELHKTNDGTLYIFKKEASNIESNLDNGTFGKIEHERMPLNNMQGRGPVIIPRANIYQSRSEYNPNSALAEEVGRILSNGIFNFNSFTHRVPMTNRF